MNSEGIKFLALQELGITELPDFDSEDDRAVNVINNNYEHIYSLALQSFNWTFSERFSELEMVKEIEGRYKKEFELPPDFLYLRGLYSNENQSIVQDYSIGNGFIFANNDKLFAKYTIKPCEETLPAYFTEFLKYKLAADLCYIITGDSALQQTLYQKEEIASRMAKNIEINQRPVMQLDTSTFTGVRF